jgi:hypothetical protein
MLSELLSSLAAPDVASRILDDAIARAGIASVPTDGQELTRFVSGALYASMERTLGQDAADALSADFLPILRALCVPVENLDDSHVRLTMRPNVLAGTTRPQPNIPEFTPAASGRPLRNESGSRFDALSIPPPPAVTPVILAPRGARTIEPAPAKSPSFSRLVLASRSVMREFELAAALGAGGTVVRVEDVFDLVDQASSEGAGHVFVVLDAKNSTVQPTTLAAATTELPAGTRVVLWGTPDVESDALGAIAPEAMLWTKLPVSTSAAELARYLLTVVL